MTEVTRRVSRRGLVIPLVVVSGTILFLMVLAFNFMSSSDYKRVARLMRDVQASALADLASDELHLEVATAPIGTDAARPQWVKDLLGELKGKTSQLIAGAKVEVEAGRLSRNALRIPVTEEAVRKISDLVQVKDIESSLGPFTLISHGLQKKHYYHEDAFTRPPANAAGTTDLDIVPLDLRGPLKVAIKIKGEGGPLNFGETYYRGQELLITDTTAPASQFAVFSFMPPPTFQYAVEDMQHGGKLNIRNNDFAKRTGRIMIQGPLFFAPEAPPTDSTNPVKKWMSWVEEAPLSLSPGTTNPGPTFPDSQWVGTPPVIPSNPWAGCMATVPNPRVALHPDRSQVPNNTSGLGTALVINPTTLNPRLQKRGLSHTHFKTKTTAQFQVNVSPGFSGGELSRAGVFWALRNIGELSKYSSSMSDALGQYSLLDLLAKVFTGELNTMVTEKCRERVNLPVPVPAIDVQAAGTSAVIAGNNPTSGGMIYQTIDESPIAYYPPTAYFYAPVPQGAQRLNIMGGDGQGTHGMPNTSLRDRCHLGVFVGAPPETPGDSQITAKQSVTATADGDAHLLEPIPGNGYSAWEKRGLYGAYGIARVESRTSIKVKIKELMRWMVKKYIQFEWPIANEEVPFCYVEENGNKNPRKFKDVALATMDEAIPQVLQQLNLDPNLDFLVRRYQLIPGGLPGAARPPAWDNDGINGPKDIEAEKFLEAVKARKMAYLPFGSYFGDADFWNQASAAQIRTDVMKGLNDPTLGTLDEATLDQHFTDLFWRTGHHDHTRVDPDRFGADVTDQTPAGKMAIWLTDTYAPRFVRGAAAGQNLGEMLENMKTQLKVIGHPKLTLTTEKRPFGAFGDYRGEAKAQVASAGGPTGGAAGPDNDFLRDVDPNFEKRGFFPPKFRHWEKIATRSYKTFDEYYNTEKNGQGELELRGAVLVLETKVTRPIKYKGRGIVILVTPADRDKGPEILEEIGPVDVNDPKNLMILVHRVHETHLTKPIKYPVLTLGKTFTGSVYSDTGVTAGQGTEVKIIGNLVTGLLNMAASSDAMTIQVLQNEKLATPVATGSNAPPGSLPMEDLWTVELSGEINSEQPDDPG